VDGHRGFPGGGPEWVVAGSFAVGSGPTACQHASADGSRDPGHLLHACSWLRDQVLARFKSRSHLPDGIGFSKLPVSSMLGLFVPHKHRFTEETDMDCQATLSISVTQCDPTSATTPLHWPAPATVHVSCPAKQLAPQQRQDLAIQVLAGTETVSELLREHEVSRKFLYQQVHTAQQALDSAFAPV